MPLRVKALTPEELKRKRKREYMREYRKRNPDKAQTYRKKAMQRDPEGYKERRNAYKRDYRRKKREQDNIIVGPSPELSGRQ